MIRTWIVDDDANSRLAAATALSAYEDVEITGQFSCGEELMAALSRDRAQLLILDIELGEEMGFDLAKLLQERCPELLIIFLTGHASYAIDGYGFHPVDFLTKPIRQSRLDEAMAEVRRRLGNRRTRQRDAQIMVRLLGGHRILDVKTILYVERRSRRMYVVTDREEMRIANYTMREMDEMLEPYGFFLCYQSVLISLYRVRSVQDAGRGLYEVSLEGTDTRLPVSRNRYDELFRRLQEINGQGK
jgi:DNA-binding LytR/AlgR family response regulator